MTFKYRADHVGSLLRPREILDARDRLPAEELTEIEDRHILGVLGHQKRIGMKIFTDGEYRRSGFMGGFFSSVSGVGPGRLDRAWSGAIVTAPYTVSGKIKPERSMTSSEVDFLIQNSPGDVKITLPTPNQFPAICYKKRVTDQFYPTYSDFLWDIVPIFRDEIAELFWKDVRYIQIDAPRYSYYIDPKWREFVRSEMGKDPEDALDEAIAVDNACIGDSRKPDNILAIHLCRGNNRSQWYAEGGYDMIAEKVFGQLNVDVFLLEYESERAGNFEPLRFVPAGKAVVLGLVSSKTPDLEDSDDLLRRIDEAAKFVPAENLALSPQCGFASVKEGNLLSEDQQWRKLELVIETAQRAWPDA